MSNANEIVHMKHDGIEGTATARRSAFDKHWKGKGWEEVDATTAEASAAAGGTDLTELTRDQLDQAARDAGVDAPEKLQNKDAVIAAIAAANGTSGDPQ